MQCITWQKQGSYGANFLKEVIGEEQVADHGEHVDENDSQDSSQQNRAPISSHRTNHVVQGLLAVHNIQQLENGGLNRRFTDAFKMKETLRFSNSPVSCRRTHGQPDQHQILLPA